MAQSSWAIECLWNKFFALKDEEQEQQFAMITQALEEAEAEISPIGTEAAVRERAEMMREFYAPLMTMRRNRSSIGSSQQQTSPPATNSLRAFMENRQAEQLERVAVNRPNLDIPQDNGDYMYLAQ
jgi:hypothetical protein